MAAGIDSDKGWLEVDRFRSRADGTSEFVRVRIPSAQTISLDDEQPGAVARLFPTLPSAGAKLVELPAGLSQEAHPAPEPQIVIVLNGRIEVETTGCKGVKSWGKGEFFIASDHDGIGHLTRVPEGPTLLMFVPLGATDLDAWTVK